MRFSTPEAAERAMEAMNRGEVVIDGMMLKAQFMQGKGRGRGTPPNATERNLEVTSSGLKKRGPKVCRSFMLYFRGGV